MIVGKVSEKQQRVIDAEVREREHNKFLSIGRDTVNQYIGNSYVQI